MHHLWGEKWHVTKLSCINPPLVQLLSINAQNYMYTMITDQFLLLPYFYHCLETGKHPLEESSFIKRVATYHRPDEHLYSGF